MSNKEGAPKAGKEEEKKKVRVQRVHSYLLMEKLGQGTYGTVRLCMHKDTHKSYALKIIEKSMLAKDEKFVTRMQREIAVLSALDHPCLNRMLEVFQSKENLYMVLEYVPGGNLLQYVIKHCSNGKKLSLITSFSIFYQVISGLEHCHKNCICHRDIKLENVLLSEFDAEHGMADGAIRAQLADFGLSNSFENNTPLLQTRCGSPHYAAPEVVKGKTYDGRKSDIWSLGVVAYTIFVGRMPFLSRDVPTVLDMIVKGQYELPKSVPSDTADYIRSMMCVDPEKRATIDTLKAHPFWQRGCAACDFDPDGWSSGALNNKGNLALKPLSAIPQMGGDAKKGAARSSGAQQPTTNPPQNTGMAPPSSAPSANLPAGGTEQHRPALTPTEANPIPSIPDSQTQPDGTEEDGEMLERIASAPLQSEALTLGQRRNPDPKTRKGGNDAFSNEQALRLAGVMTSSSIEQGEMMGQWKKGREKRLKEGNTAGAGGAGGASPNEATSPSVAASEDWEPDSAGGTHRGEAWKEDGNSNDPSMFKKMKGMFKKKGEKERKA